jgi:hypothetical protein
MLLFNLNCSLVTAAKGRFRSAAKLFLSVQTNYLNKKCIFLLIIIITRNFRTPRVAPTSQFFKGRHIDIINRIQMHKGVMTSCGILSIPSFMNIRHMVQKLLGVTDTRASIPFVKQGKQLGKTHTTYKACVAPEQGGKIIQCAGHCENPTTLRSNQRRRSSTGTGSQQLNGIKSSFLV